MPSGGAGRKAPRENGRDLLALFQVFANSFRTVAGSRHRTGELVTSHAQSAAPGIESAHVAEVDEVVEGTGRLRNFVNRDGHDFPSMVTCPNPTADSDENEVRCLPRGK